MTEQQGSTLVGVSFLTLTKTIIYMQMLGVMPAPAYARLLKLTSCDYSKSFTPLLTVVQSKLR
jgi:hypothetical protein